MAVKYIYNGDFGLDIRADHESELTEEQAKLLVARDMAVSFHNLASALADIAQEFSYKKFYDEDAPRSTPVSAVSPKRSARKKVTKKKARR